MDQKIIAGLGNIYANEILYRAKINPETPASSLSSQRLSKLIKTTKTVLNEAIEKNGTSISDYRRIDDKKGEFQNFLQIYQKTSCPQGHPVQKIKQGGRSTYFCPVCQK
jgi:formamidopyrimidine-DNA glycosylase